MAQMQRDGDEAGRGMTTPDPPPARPEKPLPFDCCESGCEHCVFDIYADELERYQSALAAWRVRNPGRDPDAG